jgi:hypothetical protein
MKRGPFGKRNEDRKIVCWMLGKTESNVMDFIEITSKLYFRCQHSHALLRQSASHPLISQ